MQTYQDTPICGIGFLRDAKPMINAKHVDGPVLVFSDGQMHWLTLQERCRFAMGWTDADKLQQKLRPNLTAALSAD